MTDVQLGTGVSAYGRLLRHGPAARPFAFAALARLTLAMIPLGILILVEHQRQAYAIAGVVSGGYAIGATHNLQRQPGPHQRHTARRAGRRDRERSA